jgi:hypothetical protein
MGSSSRGVPVSGSRVNFPARFDGLPSTAVQADPVAELEGGVTHAACLDDVALERLQETYWHMPTLALQVADLARHANRPAEYAQLNALHVNPMSSHVGANSDADVAVGDLSVRHVS